MEERAAVVERLREFLRLNYMTGTEAARRIGVRDSTLYSWLQGHSNPNSPKRIAAFLDSMPAERVRDGPLIVLSLVPNCAATT